MLWLQASASMPVVSRPVRIGDSFYLDGGISNAVPYQFMESLGYNRNMIILTQPRGYRKQAVGKVMKLILRRDPEIQAAMLHRHQMYNRQMEELDRMEADHTALIIRPPEALGIGHTERNPENLERVYQIGRQEAEKRLREIRSWF